MCSYKVVPETTGAKLVESERGEILSPKYAPETTAPAAAASDTSKPAATPISATPTVPADPQEVPVHTETTEVTKKAAMSMYSALMTLSPQ